MGTLPSLFAYVGPDTILPVTSVVAAVSGCVLMFGRNILRLALAPFQTRSPGQDRSDRK